MARNSRVAGQPADPGADLASEDELRRELDETRERLEECQRQLIEADSRFRNVWSATPVGLALANDRGEYVAVNDALCRMLGRAERDLLGRSGEAFTGPDDGPVPHDDGADLPAGAERSHWRFARPDGEVRWANVTTTDIAGPGGEAWTLACVDDITERRQAEQTLQDSERTLYELSRVTRRIQSGEDARSTIVEAVQTMTGARSAFLVEPLDEERLVITASAGSSLEGTTVAHDYDTALAECLRAGRSLFLEDPVGNPVVTPLSLAQEIGSIMWQPVLRSGRTIAVIMLKWPYRIDDISERTVRTVHLLADESSVALAQEEMRAELQSMARTDPLTELPNRRAWDDQLSVLADVAFVTGEPLAVAMVDLDHFKSFNDRHGHTAGDEHLREFARRARASVRDSDVVSRWGGEEFAVALPACSAADAGAILTRVLHAVPGDQTCSIGWATWNGHEEPEALLARVDEALYAAKAAGRNCIVAADA